MDKPTVSYTILKEFYLHPFILNVSTQFLSVRVVVNMIVGVYKAVFGTTGGVFFHFSD
jgi:hypothetical protein